MEADHPTVDIRIANEWVTIGREIAPLIDALNRLGIVTLQSCQGAMDFDGLAWVQVDSTADLIAFLDLTRESENLSERITNWSVGAPCPSDRYDAWRIAVAPWSTEGFDGPWDELTATISFPPSDLPELTALAQRRLAALERRQAVA